MQIGSGPESRSGLSLNRNDMFALTMREVEALLQLFREDKEKIKNNFVLNDLWFDAQRFVDARINREYVDSKPCTCYTFHETFNMSCPMNRD